MWIRGVVWSIHRYCISSFAFWLYPAYIAITQLSMRIPMPMHQDYVWIYIDVHCVAMAIRPCTWRLDYGTSMDICSCVDVDKLGSSWSRLLSRHIHMPHKVIGLSQLHIHDMLAWSCSQSASQSLSLPLSMYWYVAMCHLAAEQCKSTLSSTAWGRPKCSSSTHVLFFCLCQFYELRHLAMHTGGGGCSYMAWFGQ